MWDFICEYILPVLLVILIILAIGVIGMLIYKEMQLDNYFDRKDYIQNLEEKLNIYEEDYDRFCLEDSLRQSDVYE